MQYYIFFNNTLFNIILFCTFFSQLCSAQTILTGTVRDPADQPLEGILLEAETKTQPPASAFVISGADGSFKLTLAATPASDSACRPAPWATPSSLSGW
ncbi:hypothetical protein GCM10027422_13920 [Hymenobacter arcticus]